MIITQSGKLERIEQKLNALTHAVGAGLSIAAVIVLLSRAEGLLLRTTLAVYGGTQILLYLTSALTHLFYDMPRIYRGLRVVDQAAVYLLIAGTYTPVALVGLGGRPGLIVLGLEWGMALGGIALKTLVFRTPHLASDMLYLPMGWMILLVLRPLAARVSSGFLVWALAGGICYTVGVVFYAVKRIPLGHVAWHLWVLAGGTSFFIAFLNYLI